MEMELLKFETKRNIKPGDIFRAHLLASAATSGGTSLVGSTPDIDQILAAANTLQVQPVTSGIKSSLDSGMFRGHEAFSTRTGAPYHWGVSLQQPPFMNKENAEGRDETEHMERLQIGVMDAIHDALSKEALIKKLIIPFNGTLESKSSVSHWEWQKNTALLELEQRNQQLQQRLREAAKQVLEAQSRAQHDRTLLEEALKKGKEELHLISRAESMRANLIAQKLVISRRRILNLIVSTWQQFCQECRKKRNLKRSQILWHRLTLMKHFNGFIQGFENAKHIRQLKDIGKSHWERNSTGRCFLSWASHSRQCLEEKKKSSDFVREWTGYRLRIAYEGWQECCSSTDRKHIQWKRASNVWYYTHLRKAWHRWDQYVESEKDIKFYAERIQFQKLVGVSFSGWRAVVQFRTKRCEQLAVSSQARKSRLHQIVFNTWTEKISMSFAMRERVAHFVTRCSKRFQHLVLVNWYQIVLRKRPLKVVEKLIKLKLNAGTKRRTFMKLRGRWMTANTIQQRQALRFAWTRREIFLRWREEVQRRRDSKRWALQICKRVQHRLQQSLFGFWKLYAAVSRKHTSVEEAVKLVARVKVLESGMDSAERMQRQMDKLVYELRNEKTKIVHSAQSAIARTPVWTSGFLDVELRWRTPLITWLPPGRAGHTAVSLPGAYCHSRIVFFGGYNGEGCFDDVFILDTDQTATQWRTPASTAAEGSIIPPALQTHTSCAFGRDKMVLFGGYDGAREFSEVSVLKISDDGLACEWSQLQCGMGAKPGPVCQHTSCMYEGGPYMVVFGGYRSAEGLLNELWVLDLHWLQWTCPDYFGTPPVPCRGHCAAMVGTKMYIFGGYNGREHLADLHALDMETMTWECIESQGQAPSARRQHAVAVVGQHLVIYGGYDGQQYLGDVFSFDTVHRIWKQWPDRVRDTPAPTFEVGQGGQVLGRSMHTMVEAGQRLIIFGGVHEWGALQDLVFLENAAAIDGLQLQASLFEELQKTSNLQAKVTGYEKELGETTMELAKADITMEHLRRTLQVEAEKRKKAVQGHQVLTKKLQKARTTSDSLSQIGHRLRQEMGHSEAQCRQQLTKVEVEQEQIAVFEDQGSPTLAA